VKSQVDEVSAVTEDLQKKIVAEGDYVVSGVYFTCPLISKGTINNEGYSMNNSHNRFNLFFLFFRSRRVAQNKY